MLLEDSILKEEKEIKAMIKEGKRKKEQKNKLLAQISLKPEESLKLIGTKIKVKKDHLEYFAAERLERFQDWKMSSTKIDAFDIRSLLDVIPEHNPNSKMSFDDTDEDNQLNYERFKVLIDKLSSGSKKKLFWDVNSLINHF